MATNPPKNPKIPSLADLKDTDVMFPCLTAPDRLAVLMASEHVFHVLDVLWFDHLPNKKIAEANDKGGFAWGSAEEKTVRATGARANPALMIRLCYLLGLIEKPVYEALEQVRFVRNKMAHSRLPKTLRDVEMVSVAEALARYVNANLKGLPKTLQCEINEKGKDPHRIKVEGAKALFISACMILAYHLRDHSRFQKSQPESK